MVILVYVWGGGGEFFFLEDFFFYNFVFFVVIIIFQSEFYFRFIMLAYGNYNIVICGNGLGCGEEGEVRQFFFFSSSLLFGVVDVTRGVENDQ